MTYKFFFKHFLRDPKNVGALVPLSQSVAEQLSKHLGLRSDDTPWRILEVGAGTGSITQTLVAQMKKQDRLDIVEIDTDCCSLLESKFRGDKRVSVHCQSILDWKPPYNYDFIVSTLPLNSFPPEMVNKIFEHYMNISTNDAICTYVEYIGIERLSLVFANKEKREIIESRRKLLKNFLRNHLLERNKVYTNFLPCYVYHVKLHPSLSPR